MLDARLLLASGVGWAVLVAVLGADWGAPACAGVAGLGLAITGGVARARRRVPRAWSALALAGLVTALLCTSAAGHLAVRDAGPVVELARQRAVVTIEGRVDEDPRVLPADAERRTPRAVVRVLVTRVTARGVSSAVRTPIVLMGTTALAELRWRERVVVTGRLAPADPAQPVVAILAPTSPARTQAPAGFIARVAEHARGRLRTAVEPLPADARGLVPALVIGDRSLTPGLLTDDMRATGMTHLTAVSGSNVTIVIGAAVLVGGVLRVRRRWRPLVAGGALVAFVVLARPDPSVLRAAVMGAVGLLGVTASRRSAGPAALGAAVVVLLCVDPWLARSYGFALSTLATLGLLLFARPWGAAIARWLPRRARPLADATAIPLAAQATCAPVVVLLQGSVPVIGVVANLAAAIFVAPATVCGVVAALAASAWVPAGTAVAWLAALPAAAIAQIAHTLAPVPFGTLPWPDGTPGALLLAALTVAALLTAPWLTYQARRRPLAALAVGVLVIAACWPLPPAAAPAAWVFAACDVGQGDALVLASGPGRAVLVDAGPRPEPVRACLDRLRITCLDAVFLTHFHDDHVAGLPGALEGRTVGTVYVSPLADPPEQARDVQRWVQEAGATLEPVVAGASFDIGAVHLVARGPVRTIHEGSMPNNNGILLDVRTAGLRLVLLADAEREEASDLAKTLRVTPGRPAAAVEPPVDVVKVAHHGSANQDRGLVEALAAPVAVISVAADNDYGHPAPSTLDLYARAGAAVLRTDRDGDILLQPDCSPDAAQRCRVRVGRTRG